MKTLDRLMLLLVGALAGSALAVLVMGISRIGSEPDQARSLSVFGSALAAISLAVAFAWIGLKRRDSSR
ncbi:hypothetical protein [Leifsonia sp. 2MCAF36]|uniref:hypothetical protein n=1 Tax=Leifsonia sp. 2MCAF36 TaxID=3232988 RepID=UPI003F94E7A8